MSDRLKKEIALAFEAVHGLFCTKEFAIDLIEAVRKVPYGTPRYWEVVQDKLLRRLAETRALHRVRCGNLEIYGGTVEDDIPTGTVEVKIDV